MRSPDRLRFLVLAGLLLIASRDAVAKIPEKVEDTLEDYQEESWYLRTNVPFLQTGEGRAATLKALVVVSSGDGIRVMTERLTQAASAERRLSLRVNDRVQIRNFEWNSEDDSVLIELEGKGRAEDGRGVIRLSGIRDRKDLEACWVKAFSEKRLDKVAGWSPEIRKAVSRREVLPGMTREQVMVSLGTPDRVARFGEGDAEVETWTVRQPIQGGGQGPEIEIRFVAGKVERVGPALPLPASATVR